MVRKDFAVISPNFSFMAEYDETLYKCAVQAERFIFEDPNTTLYKLRQFGELLAQNIAARIGIEIAPEDNAYKIRNRNTSCFAERAYQKVSLFFKAYQEIPSAN